MAYVTGVLTNIIEQLHALTGSYGLAIILLTFIIRLVILPLTASQTRAMKKMQVLQPEIKKLQKKYRNDPERLNRETMELWRKHNINPLAGCLPMLIQLPILFAFFAALREFDFQGDPRFLWLPNLAEPDPWYILPILTAVTTFLMSRMTTPPGTEASQQVLLYVMPLFIGWLAVNFPSGLAVYWVASNLFSIAQQYLMDWTERRHVEGEPG